jgi:putative serine protease PepD
MTTTNQPADRTRPTRSAVTLAVVALTAGLVGGGVGASAYATHGPSPTTTSATTGAPASLPVPGRSSSTGVEQVAKVVTPGVVLLQVQGSQGSYEGSGIILSSTGQILTNNHVVEAAASGGQIQAVFSNGKTAPVTIVGRDPVTDLAVVRARGVSGLTPATMGDSSSLQVGQPVVAIGAPLGLQGTVTSGIVSALNRPVSSTGEGGQATVVDAIQTDAAINPGNSGGPLVDMSGHVVGIDSAIASLGSSTGAQAGSIGLGFAIPSDQAMRIVNQIKSGGPAAHALLGVSVADSATPAGAVVGDVTPGSAADAAGLVKGDVITKAGSQIVDNADSLVAAIRAESPRARMVLSYERNGSPRTTTVTLGSDQPSA